MKVRMSSPAAPFGFRQRHNAKMNEPKNYLFHNINEMSFAWFALERARRLLWSISIWRRPTDHRNCRRWINNVADIVRCGNLKILQLADQQHSSSSTPQTTLYHNITQSMHSTEVWLPDTACSILIAAAGWMLIWLWSMNEVSSTLSRTQHTLLYYVGPSGRNSPVHQTDRREIGFHSIFICYI